MRKYSDVSIMNLYDEKNTLPENNKMVVVGKGVNSSSEMTIAADRDSLEGMDRDTKNNAKVIKGKKGY